MKPVTPKVLANNIFFQIWYVVLYSVISKLNI
jgi:hypothetical protein